MPGSGSGRVHIVITGRVSTYVESTGFKEQIDRYKRSLVVGSYADDLVEVRVEGAGMSVGLEQGFSTYSSNGQDEGFRRLLNVSSHSQWSS